MGWTSCDNWSTRKDIIKEVLSPSHHKYMDGTQGVCLESCYKGGPTNGRLWVLFEKPLKSGGSYRFILLYLLEKHHGQNEWAYKDLSEHVGPYEVDCPLRFLEQAPLDQIDGDNGGEKPSEYATAWREKVKAYHANKPKLSNIEVGKTYYCKSNSKDIPHVKIVSKHPLAGEYQGFTYRIKKSLLVLDNAIGKVVDACIVKTGTP